MIRLFATTVALLLALPVLAAPGDVRRFPAQGAATAQLRIHGTTDIEVVAVGRIPLDRRHRSKVDHRALRAALRRA